MNEVVYLITPYKVKSIKKEVQHEEGPTMKQRREHLTTDDKQGVIIRYLRLSFVVLKPSKMARHPGMEKKMPPPVPQHRF